ncbi:sigma-54-dependent transcriptional regulator [Thiovibrio frasassiensis]|uniref:Sigma-54 dependent transcriptional regulator n=1 Tax=Thiovibrio frasassiensis TaxID=2984131 RepID=A0A9X4RM08_9BACT|nr:sigma-54 dependent transcriptional regulator [Thiovibrio frasassiensis]MDG4476259.1 sigma-54 dependent transcriptional regulator [Thiovibrio frasassiensis]
MDKQLSPVSPILLVDDEEAWLHSFSLTLRSVGLSNIRCCADSRKVMEILASEEVGVIVLDLTMPHLSGETLLPEIVREHPQIPVIIITGLDLVDTAVQCMKLGAFDYYTKVSEETRLIAGVQRAVDLSRLRQENDLLKEHFLKDKLDHPEAFSRIATHNKGMRSIFQYMESIANTSEPVLISGETGVGKELIAQALHALSKRKGEFVPLNAAGLDDTMFADTLFGHKKGAFTGADQTRRGLIEQATGGTLFLDEIGDLSLLSQTKLLRLLQEREYLPLGSDLPKRTDCRMIFATHQNLQEMQTEGTFRKDLYYRLHAHRIHIPPLRERLDDLPLLVDLFFEEGAARLNKKKPAFPKELISLLGTYDFPGNIRELQNMIFDAVSTHKNRTLSMDSFKDYLRLRRPHLDGEVKKVPQTQTPFSDLPQLPSIKEASYLLVLEALNRANGNQTIAAEMLGITRQALNWRLKQADREI